MSRVYIGRLSDRAREKDVEHFFRGYGRIRDIYLKQGFGFIEFEDRRDAEDAIDDLNGKELVDSRVTLELARRDPRSSDSYGFNSRSSRRRSPPRGPLRFSPPRNTRHRLVVSNLTTRYSWQDLKDLFRDAGFHITFADAHRTRANEGIVCFSNDEDMLRAKEKFDGHEVNGRNLKITVDDGRARSRSRSPRKSRSRSAGSRRSRSRSKGSSRSRSKSKSKSRSRSKSASKSKSRSKSPGADDVKKEEKADDKSRSPSKDKDSDKGSDKDD